MLGLRFIVGDDPLGNFELGGQITLGVAGGFSNASQPFPKRVFRVQMTRFLFCQNQLQNRDGCLIITYTYK